MLIYFFNMHIAYQFSGWNVFEAPFLLNIGYWFIQYYPCILLCIENRSFTKYILVSFSSDISSNILTITIPIKIHTLS